MIIHVTTTINDKTQAELKNSPVEKHWERERWIINSCVVDELNHVNNEGMVEATVHVNVRNERSVHESSYKTEVPA